MPVLPASDTPEFIDDAVDDTPLPEARGGGAPAPSADEGRARLTALIAANREAALRSEDPQTRAGLIDATRDNIEAARRSGLFTVAEAQAAREGFVRNYEADRDDRFSVALQTDLGTAGDALTKDPSTFATVQAGMMQRIDNSGLSDERKAELRGKVNGSLARDALQGQVATAPEQAKAELAKGAWDDYIDADQKVAALDAADVQIARDTNRADLQRRQVSQAAEDKIVQQISADDRSLSAMAIAQDAALSPDKQREMIGVLRQSTQPDPAPATSRAATLDLYKRIYADDGDPLKLRDTSAINQAFAAGTLTRADFYRLRQELAEAQTPEGQALGRRKATYLQAVEPLIDSADVAGQMQFYDYLVNVDRAVAKYKKEGKDPYDLFDPSKPDYLGKPAALEPYTSALRRIGAATADGIKEGFGDAPLGLRPEGEQYLRDIGVFPNPGKGTPTVIQYFNEGLIKSAAVTIDAGLRSLNALGVGGAVAAGKTLEEATGDASQGNKLTRDIVALEQILPFLGGVTARPGGLKVPRAVRGTESAVNESEIGAPKIVSSVESAEQPISINVLERAADGYQAVREAIGRMYHRLSNTKPERRDIVDIGPVSEQGVQIIGDEFRRATGNNVDVTGHRHVIDGSAMRHMDKGHGDTMTEASRGQIALTAEDFRRIPDILSDADVVKASAKKTARGLHAIGYWKQFSDGVVYYIEEVRTGRKQLAATTMYKFQGWPEGAPRRPNSGAVHKE